MNGWLRGYRSVWEVSLAALTATEVGRQFMHARMWVVGIVWDCGQCSSPPVAVFGVTDLVPNSCASVGAPFHRQKSLRAFKHAYR